VQTQALLVIIMEGELPRQIFLDGGSHPKDWNPAWLGHSIGHWDGDTLVVDTTGFNDKTWFGGQGPTATPHTEKMHITEGYRRADLGHLEIEVTIEDPDTFIKPWIFKRAAELAPDDEIQEYVCTENDATASTWPASDTKVELYIYGPYRWVRIPAKPNADSGRKPNGIPG
jgi:hypothetical protein